jgi:threonine dehydrogenase-like Zn-dependent dehydrogenase
MRGLYLPGDRRAELRDVPDPRPGHAQVLIQMRASTICGSDLRAIYREHLGTGPEAYRDVIAGHEPSGEIVELGPGCRRFRAGDRVVVYHIAGCGLCGDCRSGYMINCTSPDRAAYGWQRDGGHADLLLAEERTCVPLPDELSYLDGACVACGFGTAYEALLRAGVSGRDSVLVVGLGPIGLGVGLLAHRLGANRVVGIDVEQSRVDRARGIDAIDVGVIAGTDLGDAGGPCDVSVDCSGTAAGRMSALAGLRTWGRCVFVGEGSDLRVDVSPWIIHPQLTISGSWVTSIGHMEELVGLLAAWHLHPDVTVTDRFPLDRGADAYALADRGDAGKVAIEMPA